MKRLILSILACLLLAAPAMAFDGACQDGEPWQLARMNPAVLGSGGSAACDTENDSELISQGSNASNASLSTYYVAAPFTVTAGTYVTSYTIMLRDTTATGNITTCGVYSDSSGVPGSLIDGTEKTDNYSTNSWASRTFILDSSVELIDTVYYLKCHSASAGMLWGVIATVGTYCTDADNINWACSVTGTPSLVLMGCAP